MTVTAVRKDADKLTLTLDAEFEATPERVWQLWADPRQLERWWGPPSYPATFTSLDCEPAAGRVLHDRPGRATSPLGYWEIVEVEPPQRIVILDGFANADGSPNERDAGRAR